MSQRHNSSSGMASIRSHNGLSLCPLRDGGLFPSEIPTTGAALKTVEDQLDSLVCAYVGAYWWYWGEERNLVLGDV